MKPIIASDRKILQLTEEISDADKIDYQEIPLQSIEENRSNNTTTACNNNENNNQRNISIIKLLTHLCEPLDYFFIILAILGSIIEGFTRPITSYYCGDTYSSVAESHFNYNSTDPIILTEIQQAIEDKFTSQINQLLAIGIAMFFAQFFHTFLWTYIGFRLTYKLKANYLKVILQQEQGWFDQSNPYELTTKFQAQLEQFELGIGERIGIVFTMLSQIISGLLVALIVSYKLTLAMLTISPLVVITTVYFASEVNKSSIKGRQAYEKSGGIAEEILYNIKTVASFANFAFEQERFNKTIDYVGIIDHDTAYKQGMSIGGVVFFIHCSFVIAFCYGRDLVIAKEKNPLNDNKLTGGDVITVLFAVMIAVLSIGAVSPNIKIILDACSATSDYFNLLMRKPRINLLSSCEKPNMKDLKGSIQFHDVSFSYPSNRKEIIKEMNISFPSGKKIAIVGESGCGKSTIVNLIERLYEPTSGFITIDNINIKDYDINYLRSLIGYVQQEPILFNKSINDNIIFGREHTLGNLSSKEALIKEACDDAYASEFISCFKEKYDYIVGTKGNKLSVGQKQRIAIARALLTKPKILIFDEATSALDINSENEVKKALDNIILKNINMTVIIIAHRLSTIKNADVIYAMKKGRIIEQGTHSELMLLNEGYYANMIRSQFESKGNYKDYKSIIKEKESADSQEIINNNNDENKGNDKFSIANDDFLSIALQHKNIKVKRSRIFNELQGNKSDIFLASLGAACNGILQALFGFLIAKAMNALNSSNENIIKHEGLFYGLMFLLFSFLHGLFNYIMTWKYSSIGIILSVIFRKKVFYKYLTLHMAFFDLIEHTPGSLITSLAIETMQLNSIILSLIGSTINVICLIVTCISLALYYDWRLTLITIVFVPFFSYSMFAKACLKRSTNIKSIQAKIDAGNILSESVINSKTIYSYNFQSKAVELFMEAIFYIKQEFIHDSFINGLFMAIGQFSIYCVYATVFYASKCFLINNTLTPQNMAMAINIVMLCAGGVGNCLSQIGDYKKAIIAFKSLYSKLDTSTLIDPTTEGNHGKRTANRIKGKIEFRNVTFAYPTRPKQNVLTNINFIINPGQSIALVGCSGSGKSTIIQLLERFYDIEDHNGEILVDDVNIKEYDLYELRKRIGLVSQEPVLFKRNMMENVRYGRLDASDNEVIDAARKANIMNVFSLNKDNEEIIGSKEDPVSGGEKQRLAIARIFLKNPNILLLDEPTSSLDKESENLIQDSLIKLSHNRTSITIAHRLSTIEHCDMILVIDNGVIIEQGNHTNLMELKGKYYSFNQYSNSTIPTFN